MYHQDWLMRQIDMIILFLIRFLSGEDRSKEEFTLVQTNTNELYARLRELLDRDQICEAENLLYDWADGTDYTAFHAALQFYQDINEYSEQRLEACNFSRQEILDGLWEICGRYQVSEALLVLRPDNFQEDAT